jgi:hypothetical protein
VRRLALVLSLLVVAVPVVGSPTPAAASWAVGSAVTVAPAACPSTGWSADAAMGADGQVRGFVRFQGAACTDTRLTWFEGAGGSWRRVPSTYRGKVLAVADDGAATWVLYGAADGTRLGSRDRAGVFHPSSVTSFVDGALDERAHGGSLYDYRTTAPAFWADLERLASL